MLTSIKFDHCPLATSSHFIFFSSGRVNTNSTKAICIKFKKIDSNQTDMPKNYVNFFPGNKCDSTVGRPFDPNKHNVSIGNHPEDSN